jgi:hexosaminidase
MRLHKPFALIGVVLAQWLIVSASANALDLPLTLVPLPAHVARTGGSFLLGPKTVIAVMPKPADLAIGTMLAQRLRVATGYAVPVKINDGDSAAVGPNTIALATDATAALGREGYSLQVMPRGIVIHAVQPAGLFYGTQTLRQLLPAQIESRSRCPGVVWRVPGVRIWDQPRFSVRGLMIDSARHLQSLSFLKQTLDRMAYHKLNTFHWHLTDDQGWRIEIKRYPKLTQIGAWRTENGKRYGGFYTQSQIRALVTYAAARQITIVPEIDMPAHSHAALASYPEIGCVQGPFSVLNMGQSSEDVMDPGKPETYRFVEGVLTEVMALFPSKAIHIGGDECPKAQWESAPECQALMQQKGLKDEDALQNYFTQHLARFLAAHGRRLQGWNEILNGGPLPVEAIVQQWSDPEAARTAARAGNDVVVSSSSHVYFDASSDAVPLQQVYSFEPMPTGLSSVQSRHILGVEACLWTETKPADAVANEYIWPRLMAVAEVAWSPPLSRDWLGFVSRLSGTHYARLVLMGVDTRQALIDRSDFDWGVRIGVWSPTEMSEQWKTLDWDVTASLHGAGMYTLHLNYEGGADALAVTSAQLLRDGSVVADDVHAGWTGGVHYGRVYHLSLENYNPAARYVLRVRLRSDGGTDSRGALWLAGPSGQRQKKEKL